MRVLALNGSPRMDKGNTALILTPFVTGMREAGAEVEVLYSRNLKINPCASDLSCWFKTPGVCCQDDDMRDIYPKLRAADVWVLATPVYVDGMTGPLKNLVDRLIALLRPVIELHDGHCRHPLPEERRGGKVVLVASCAYWEMDNFDPLVAHVKALCRNVDRELAGALLRPHAAAVKMAIIADRPVDDVFAAAADAGRQLVENGAMATTTLGAVGREIMSLDAYVEAFNQWVRRASARG